MARRKPTSTPEDYSPPSASSAPTPSTASSPALPETPSDDAPPTQESTADDAAQPADEPAEQANGLDDVHVEIANSFADAIEHLTLLGNAVDRYSTQIGHWDDVLFALESVDAFLHGQGVRRKELMTEARIPTTE